MWIVVITVALALLGCESKPSDPGPPSAEPMTPDTQQREDTPRGAGLDREHDANPRGTELGELTWLEAEQLLGPDTVVAIPLGAAAKEHGPHLRLDNDLTLATYYRDRVLQAAEVVMLPTVPYHYYPAFGEYPGSTSLRLETARDLIVDIVRSVARHGPRRFYVINTGVSTNRALAPAAELLAREGVLLRYTKLLEVAGPVEAEISEQPGGTHADEIETSMILYMAPGRVDMSKAEADYHPRGARGWLSRDPDTDETYSKTGCWGDPTLATRAKGERVVEAILAGMLADIDRLRGSPLPPAPALDPDPDPDPGP